MTQPRRANALRRQVVLVTSALTTAAMLLLVVLVQLVLHRVVSDNIDTVLHDRARSALAAVGDAGPGGVATDHDDLGDGVAVFDRRGTRVSGTVPPEVAGAVAELATTRTQRTVEVDERTRILAVPVVKPPGGVVVATESVAPYERAELYALVVSVALGLVTVAGVAVLTAWTVRRSLSPVATMAATADDWSAHDLGSRFELGPPTNEITALGATLDRLLDRVARALHAEQRLTAEVAHELRTPLTALIGSVDVALLRTDLDPRTRGSFEEIGAAARRMATTVTTLVDLARAGDTAFVESGTVGEVLDGLDLAGVDVVTGPADRAVEVGLPAALAVRAVAPVLDNARRHSRSSVRVTPRAAARHVDLVVDDDGAGVAAEESAGIFDPGARGPASTGAGLGLPLARRIARSAGGDVFWEAAESGARFVVRLPRR